MKACDIEGTADPADAALLEVGTETKQARQESHRISGTLHQIVWVKEIDHHALWKDRLPPARARDVMIGLPESSC